MEPEIQPGRHRQPRGNRFQLHGVGCGIPEQRDGGGERSLLRFGAAFQALPESAEEGALCDGRVIRREVHPGHRLQDLPGEQSLRF